MHVEEQRIHTCQFRSIAISNSSSSILHLNILLRSSNECMKSPTASFFGAPRRRLPSEPSTSAVGLPLPQMQMNNINLLLVSSPSLGAVITNAVAARIVTLVQSIVAVQTVKLAPQVHASLEGHLRRPVHRLHVVAALLMIRSHARLPRTALQHQFKGHAQRSAPTLAILALMIAIVCLIQANRPTEERVREVARRIHSVIHRYLVHTNKVPCIDSDDILTNQDSNRLANNCSSGDILTNQTILLRMSIMYT